VSFKTFSQQRKSGKAHQVIEKYQQKYDELADKADAKIEKIQSYEDV